MVADSVLDWLLTRDVSVQFQATRDVLGTEVESLRSRIATEGEGAAILAARGPDGHWGRGFYLPYWTSTHYTLLELRELGLASDNPRAREAVDMILKTQKSRDGGLDPNPRARHSDVCINGMALNYCSYFGAGTASLESVADMILAQHMSDGGFNCSSNRAGARHSSVHTTLSVFEGITSYRRAGHLHRLDDLLEARNSSLDFLLRHRLYRSERTGEAIRPEFTELHHPARWRYDILRCLDALADARVAHDDRMDDAIEVIRSRRRSDGRWPAARGYRGETHVRYPRAGTPNGWVTLRALRVLATYGR
ncbi:MAG: hypothetical protein WBG36_07640 [Ornithinimicrobium sp.]